MSVVNVNGTISLFFANFIGKIFGAIYRIPLSNFLGAEGMGLYQMAFPIYSFLLTMITGGISITLTRKIAISRAKNNVFQIEKDFLIAKRISLFLGLIFLAVLLIFSYPFSYLQGNTSAVYGYIAISFGFVFACMLGAYRGYYQGYGRMIPTAISQVIEQLIKLVLGVVFTISFIRYGLIYGVFGAILGVSVSEFISFIFFKILSRKIRPSKQKINKIDYLNFFKQILPVGTTYGILPLSSLIDSFLIINLLIIAGFSSSFATSLYGIETGMILPLINMPNVLISAIAITSLPDLTYKRAKREDLTSSIVSMFKIVYVFILPCAVGLFVLSRELIGLVYPNLEINLINIASLLLKLSVFEMFFLCFVTITNSILQSMGEIKTPAKNLFVGIFVKIFLIFAFVANTNLNIYGYVIASTIGYFVSSLLNVIKIKQKSEFRLNIIEVLSPLFACVVMLVCLLFFLNFIKNITIVNGLVIILICAMLYFLVLALFGQLKLKEIKNLLQKTLK